MDDQAVERAASEGRRAYARQLRAEHWACIETVRQRRILLRNAHNEEAIRDLLDSRAVLQYLNEEEWYGLNPLVADLRNPNPAQPSE